LVQFLITTQDLLLPGFVSYQLFNIPTTMSWYWVHFKTFIPASVWCWAQICVFGGYEASIYTGYWNCYETNTRLVLPLVFQESQYGSIVWLILISYGKPQSSKKILLLWWASLIGPSQKKSNKIKTIKL
jgi:hypothetical protein